MLFQPPVLTSHDLYHPLYIPFTPVENHAYARTAPRSSFGNLGALNRRLEPIHTLVPVIAEGVHYWLYLVDNSSSQVFGDQDTSINKQLKRLRDSAADFVTYDGSRPTTLPKILKNIRIGLNKAYLSKGMALVVFGRPCPRKPVGSTPPQSLAMFASAVHPVVLHRGDSLRPTSSGI